MLSLKINDVLTDDGTLKPSVYFKRRHIKGKLKGESVPLHSRVIDALYVWLIALEKDIPLHMNDDLFQSLQTGRAISRITAYHVYKRAFRRAGVLGKTGTHSCRKAFGERVHDIHGRDLNITRILMGHVSANSTAAYLNKDKRELWAKTMDEL